VARKTRETDVVLDLNLDGEGRSRVRSGIGFLDHMLASLATHARFDLDLRCRGDLHVDAHHSVEDVGIALGQALKQALGDKKGLVRFGHAYVPLDEALSRAVVDLSGRPWLHFGVQFRAQRIGDLPTELLEDSSGPSWTTAASTCTSTCCGAATPTTSRKACSRPRRAPSRPRWPSTRG
jgi:imidazoleglycerol-phosphate dehydratase